MSQLVSISQQGAKLLVVFSVGAEQWASEADALALAQVLYPSMQLYVKRLSDLEFEVSRNAQG